LKKTDLGNQTYIRFQSPNLREFVFVAPNSYFPHNLSFQPFFAEMLSHPRSAKLVCEPGLPFDLFE